MGDVRSILKLIELYTFVKFRDCSTMMTFILPSTSSQSRVHSKIQIDSLLCFSVVCDTVTVSVCCRWVRSLSCNLVHKGFCPNSKDSNPGLETYGYSLVTTEVEPGRVFNIPINAQAHRVRIRTCA